MRIDGTTWRRWGRWVGTFVGFPVGGVAARWVVGDIDSATAAVVGGATAGAVLGTVQVVVGSAAHGTRARWLAATVIGLGAGLGAGANAVDFGTGTWDLVTMGAICGVGVGVAQALSVPMRTADRLAWALATPALWALGWWITSQVIVDAERRHAVFGSSGALAVAALSGLLHVARSRSGERGTTIGSIAPAVVR